VLGLVCTAAGADGSRYLQVGIVDDAQLLYGNAAATIADYTELHVEVVPVTLTWGGVNGVANADPVHPSDPGDPAYDWSIYDQLVRRITAAGMHVVFTIVGTPGWANGFRGSNVAPSNAADLRAFAVAAAKRYSGTFKTQGVVLPAVREWIAWNEPNNPVFLTPQWQRENGHWVVASAMAYARICNAIYDGVHSTAVKGELVACGATAPRGNNEASSGRPSVAPLAFLRAVKRYGLQTFDAWAHHPYPDRPSETPADADPSGESVELGNIESLISLVTKLYGDKRIWVTEYAYETNPPDPYFGVSWKLQARYLTQSFAIARANPRIDMMLWFLLKDDTSANGWHSGLLTSSGQKKPAWGAFQAMAAAIQRH
jgi:hypothetical protein